jgi:hypothetical protein
MSNSNSVAIQENRQKDEVTALPFRHSQHAINIKYHLGIVQAVLVYQSSSCIKYMSTYTYNSSFFVSRIGTMVNASSQKATSCAANRQVNSIMV